MTIIGDVATSRLVDATESISLDSVSCTVSMLARRETCLFPRHFANEDAHLGALIEPSPRLRSLAVFFFHPLSFCKLKVLLRTDVLYGLMRDDENRVTNG
jgi:hypothetical protein